MGYDVISGTQMTDLEALAPLVGKLAIGMNMGKCRTLRTVYFMRMWFP